MNGIWEGKIIFDTNPNNATGYLDVKVQIRQDLLTIYMDLLSATSKSHTLLAYPKNESGNKILYYVYQNTPNDPKRPPFNGSARLEVGGSKNAPELQGNYFTNRNSLGRIQLKRISDNPNDSYGLSSTLP